MHWKKAFPTEYLDRGDVTPPIVIEIESVAIETVEDKATKRKNERLVAKLKSDDGKKWIINKTNAVKLAEMFGIDTDKWSGKRVTVCHTLVELYGKKKGKQIRNPGNSNEPGGLRIKEEKTEQCVSKS